MAGVVPEFVLMRPKLGFPVPIRHWLADELFGWAAQVISESDTGRLIDKAYALDLLRQRETEVVAAEPAAAA